MSGNAKLLPREKRPVRVCVQYPENQCIVSKSKDKKNLYGWCWYSNVLAEMINELTKNSSVVNSVRYSACLWIHLFLVVCVARGLRRVSVDVTPHVPES